MGKKTIISGSAVALSLGLVLGLFSVNAFATGETSKIQPRTTENDGIMLLEDQGNYDSEVVVIDDDEDDEEEIEEVEVETEPEMWPVYVSLGALGVMILMIIVLNLTSKKKK